MTAVLAGRHLLKSGALQQPRYDQRDAYQLYLASADWRYTRELRLQLDSYCCQGCGAHEDLEVHHLTYERLGGENIYTDLVTLCGRCHSDVHAFQRGTGLPLGRATALYLEGRNPGRYA